MGDTTSHTGSLEADGQLSLQEFETIVRDPQVKHWLSSMDLDTSDARNLFAMIDVDKSNHLSFHELVTGVSRLKGAARSIDLLSLVRDHQALCNSVASLKANINRQQSGHDVSCLQVRAV